jgi:hypothetical protein
VAFDAVHQKIADGLIERVMAMEARLASDG